MSGVPHPGPPPGDQARGGAAPATHAPAAVGPGGDHGRTGGDQQRSDTRDPWPRDFGRDGVSGLVSLDRAMRARDVSRPGPADEAAAEEALPDLLARVEGRPRTDQRSRSTRPGQGADTQRGASDRTS